MPGGIHPPLEVMLSWPTPNYINPTTRPKVLTVLGCVFGPLTIIVLLARLWVRIRLQRSAGWDDWMMVAASVPIVVLTVLIPLAADVHRFNRHAWDIEPQNFPIQRKYVMAIESIFCSGSGLIKISILLFYRRLSTRVVSKTFRWATRLTIVFIAAYSIAFTLVPIFGCRPISAFWDQVDVVKQLNGYKYQCFNEGADVFSAAVISASQDLLTAVLPTFLYWNLHIPFRQKVALFGIFAIGYCIVAIGALRSYYSWKIFFATYDVTWSTWDILLWTFIELHLGAMCANAPALKVFFKQYLKLDRLSTRSKSGSGGSRSKEISTSAVGSSGTGSPFAKLAFWNSTHSYNKNGYLSEPHTDTSVDRHGGVQLQKDVRITDSPISRHSSTAILSGGFHDDIEMGDVQSPSQCSDSKSVDEEDMQALPHPPSQSQPRTFANATPRPPPPAATKNDMHPSLLKSKSRTPAWQSWT